jgi:hypothetical protein
MGIMVPTIKRWVTILPGLFGYGAFCSLIAIMTGSRMPRLHAAALTLVLIATAALLKSFVDRPLNLLDRIALLLFVSCIALSMTKDTFTMYLAWSVGLSFVLVAWLTNLIQVSRDYNVPLRPYDPAAHRTGRS